MKTTGEKNIRRIKILSSMLLSGYQKRNRLVRRHPVARRENSAELFKTGGDWLHPDIHVFKSQIHRRGCFAKKALVKGTVAFIFGGTVFYQNLKELKKKEHGYKDCFYHSVIHLIDDFYLKVSDDFSAPVKSRLINHSCDPNLIFEGSVVVRTRRDILPDEELCLDYGALGHPDDERLVIERCLCKKPSCRKQIYSYDWKNPALQQRYGLSFPTALLKRIKKQVHN